MTCGVCWVAYGEPARREALKSRDSLRKFRPDLPCAVASTEPLEGFDHWLDIPDEDRGARLAKLKLDLWTPFERTLYMDADTRFEGDPSPGFAILADGWDLAIAPSANQMWDGRDGWLWHCAPADRDDVLRVYGFFALVLQGGMMFVAKNNRVHSFFEAWRAEWRRYKDKDQGALLRALATAPVRVWVLARAWNGQRGEVIRHLFGAARRW